ncbi:paired amphipathic helix protein Sin3-like 2 [Brassica napus]|uniref:Histone deacetylase interacting domain-containing protein n=1 Tax=Brassica oleracea var. oleracea TaxID=109376 RepID=A0A0D3AB09_BRAOL|nr:PREDICTED: paired amphipathic helix protein Sin3-like 2 [Brassica oleracea var. oleracea]XP_013669820.2 paired amphipathic helix protein Sin3-like 2 [Brassica napus]
MTTQQHRYKSSRVRNEEEIRFKEKGMVKKKKKNALELWSIFKERLTPTDLKTLTSLLIDSNRRRIDKTQLIASALVLFKKDDFLHRCFTDFLNKPQEEDEEEDEDKALSEVEAESLKNFCKMVSKGLGPSELLELVSSVKDFGKKKIKLSQFRKSLSLLFKNNGQEDERGKTQQNVQDTGLELEEGEIREDGLGVRAKVGNKSKEDQKIGADAAEIRVSEERELVKDVTHGLDKMDLEGKKRRLLQTTERSLKKARTSSRQLERVTPSYKLIPEEEQCPVSNKVLNNKYAVMQFKGASRRKKLSKYEEAVARCEEDMFESDMLMEALKSAVESAEQVIKEEMSLENLGVKFYRCIERLYRGDMFAVVREDHKTVLPVILIRLKQKLDAVRVAREIWIPMWKQVFEDNTIKQRESTTFRRR